MDLRKQKALPLLLVSMFLLATAIGMPVVASSQSPNDVVAEPAVATVAVTTAPLGPISTPYCGPIDLTIALDNTGSMGGAIDNIKAELPTIIATALAASDDDLRVGYMTFKDDITVHNQLTIDIAAVEASILATTASLGAGGPEASEEAKNTAVNNLPGGTREDSTGYEGMQYGDYTETYRPLALKLVILITDAPPGGFNDIQDAADNAALSIDHANAALTKGIKVSDIFVPTYTPDPDYGGQAALLESDATITGGVYIRVNADGTGTGEAITAIIEACGGEPEVQNRMTGGGILVDEMDKKNKVTHGFELHCDASEGPNNLQVNWGKGNKFHLETLNKALCSDNPAINPNPPKAGFDTYRGVGTGSYNGVSGATATWTFTDAGQPGKNDFAGIVITDAGGNIVLSVSGNLRGGNHQAHTK